MSDARARRTRGPTTAPGSHVPRHADPGHPGSDEAGRWDIGYRPWRGAGSPSIDTPAIGVAWGELPVRAIAFLLDLVLIQFLVSNVGQAMAWVLSQTVLKSSGVSDPTLSAWLGSGLPVGVLAVIQVVAFVYFWRVFRASPGQMALGLFTVGSRDGLSLSKSRAFIRWLLLYMPAWLLTAGSAISVVLAFGVSRNFDQSTVSGLLATLPILWYLVLAISVGLSGRGRGLHDIAAASVVVRAEDR
jgi:uncharacterized RDD family membrane protein YckC